MLLKYAKQSPKIKVALFSFAIKLIAVVVIIVSTNLLQNVYESLSRSINSSSSEIDLNYLKNKLKIIQIKNSYIDSTISSFERTSQNTMNYNHLFQNDLRSGISLLKYDIHNRIISEISAKQLDISGRSSYHEFIDLLRIIGSNPANESITFVALKATPEEDIEFKLSLVFSKRLIDIFYE